MNKKDMETISARIAELTQKWENNQQEIMRHQQQILQLQQEVQRLRELDQSLRGGISELERLLKDQAPEEDTEEAPEEKEEEKDG